MSQDSNDSIQVIRWDDEQEQPKQQMPIKITQIEPPKQTQSLPVKQSSIRPQYEDVGISTYMQRADPEENDDHMRDSIWSKCDPPSITVEPVQVGPVAPTIEEVKPTKFIDEPKVQKPKKSKKTHIISFKITESLVDFSSSDGSTFSKHFSPSYLSYLQEYFSVNFNILLPKVDQSPVDLLCTYLVDEHYIQLDAFLREQRFSEEPESEKKPMEQIKNRLMEGIWSGVQAISNTIKKVKNQQAPSQSQKFHNFVQTELNFSRRLLESLNMIKNVTEVTVQPTHHAQKITEKQKILKCLNFLMAFQATEQKIRKLIDQMQNRKVQQDKLQRMLNEFSQKKNQWTDRMKQELCSESSVYRS